MFNALVCLGLLAANLETAPARETVVLLDLQGELDAEARRVIGELVATELQRYEHLEVLSQADLRQALSLESERANLGCSEQSCLAEIAGAYNARMVVFGNAGRLGELVVVSLNLFDSNAGKSRARETLQVKQLAEVPAQLRKVVPKLLALDPVEEVEESDEAITRAPRSGLFWAGAGGLGIGLVGAVGLGGAALAVDGSLEDHSGEDLDTQRSLGLAALAGAAVFSLVAVGGGVLLAMEMGE